MDPLLKLLHDNASIKPGQLAKMLNQPEAEVSARIKAYESSQVILGYCAILNDEKTSGEFVHGRSRVASSDTASSP